MIQHCHTFNLLQNLFHLHAMFPDAKKSLCDSRRCNEKSNGAAGCPTKISKMIRFEGLHNWLATAAAVPFSLAIFLHTRDSPETRCLSANRVADLSGAACQKYIKNNPQIMCIPNQAENTRLCNQSGSEYAHLCAQPHAWLNLEEHWTLYTFPKLPSPERT